VQMRDFKTTYKSTCQLIACVGWIALLTSCYQTTVVIIDLPENTPEEAPIFVAGNFNYWDPADPNFLMLKNEKGQYSIDLPRGTGYLQYKFTRGDWTTVEGTVCGNFRDDRYLEYKSSQEIEVSIDGWEDLTPIDCPTVRIIVQELPENTPEYAPIYLMGNFNAWNTCNLQHVLQKNDFGQLYIELPRPEENQRYEYKFTRGSEETIEVDAKGFDIENRYFYFGASDTTFVTIANWKDLKTPELLDLVIIVDKLPPETPTNTSIYLVGDFNDWNPSDKQLILEKNENGQHFIHLLLKNRKMEYKFTRGSWKTVEGDRDGLMLRNRQFVYKGKDTIRTEITGWEDLTRQ